MSLGVAVLGTGRLGGRYIDVVKSTPGARMVAVAEPRAEAAAPWKEKHEKADSFLDEFTDFVRSIERGDPDTPIPQEHGLLVLRVLEAGEESSRTGREVRIK